MPKEFSNSRERIFLYYKIKKANCSMLKVVIISCFYMIFNDFFISGSNKGFLFVEPSIKRDDYSKIYSTVYEQCWHEKSRISFKRRRRLSLYRIFIAITKLPYLFRLRKIEKPDKSFIICSPLVMLAIYFQTIEMLGIKKNLDKFNLSASKGIVILGDIWDLERVFSNYANSKGILTITMQHAIFPADVYENSYDILNYWKVPSRVALVWGNKSEVLFKKYSTGIKTIVCGNPMIEYTHSEDDDSDIIGIVSDIPKYSNYNQEMINIAEQYAKEFKRRVFIRIHPTDTENNYTIDSTVSEFKNDINNAEFLIAHTSTMMYTCMVQGKKVFKLESDISFHEIDKRICFNTLTKLRVCFNSSSSIDFEAIAKEQISHIGAESKENYKNAFKMICESY
jgi:hypothetical protein